MELPWASTCHGSFAPRSFGPLTVGAPRAETGEVVYTHVLSKNDLGSRCVGKVEQAARDEVPRAEPFFDPGTRGAHRARLRVHLAARSLPDVRRAADTEHRGKHERKQAGVHAGILLQRADRLNDLIVFGKTPGDVLRIHQFTVSGNVEDAPAALDQLDLGAELLLQYGLQPGGAR